MKKNIFGVAVCGLYLSGAVAQGEVIVFENNVEPIYYINSDGWRYFPPRHLLSIQLGPHEQLPKVGPSPRDGSTFTIWTEDSFCKYDVTGRYRLSFRIGSGSAVAQDSPVTLFSGGVWIRSSALPNNARRSRGCGWS